MNVVTLFLLVAIKNFILYPVNGPRGVIALSKCPPKVCKFLLEKLWVSVDCFGPVGECPYDTILNRKTVMAVPLQVLICMSGLVVH